MCLSSNRAGWKVDRVRGLWAGPPTWRFTAGWPAGAPFWVTIDVSVFREFFLDWSDSLEKFPSIFWSFFFPFLFSDFLLPFCYKLGNWGGTAWLGLCEITTIRFWVTASWTGLCIKCFLNVWIFWHLFWWLRSVFVYVTLLDVFLKHDVCI